ncbi:MAG: hypothetical protein AAFW73_13895 [Bacteroidota bacterium]
MRYFLENTDRLQSSDATFIYDPELSDFSSVSSDIAHFLKEQKVIFKLELNGISIPVGLWGDFPYFLDAFEGYAEFLFDDETDDYSIFLLEQGIETVIHLDKLDKHTRISEHKFLRGTYLKPLESLKSDATNFFYHLNELVEQNIPSVAREHLYTTWKENLYNLLPR